MPIRIIKSTEPIKVDRLNLCIYGQPGIGKSSLAFTADEPLLLDFDKGAHRAANRKDIVPVSTWGDVADLTADDLKPYRTVIVDTAGRALDHLTADIIKRDAKAGRGGVLTLQGYGKLKGEFIAWMKHVNSLGKDVVLIAHMDEQRSGDEIIERLDIQGGSKGEIYKAADAMGRVSMRNGARTLNFNPSDAAFGKNPGQLDPIALPHPDKDPKFLGSVIQSIKDRLNALTVEQSAAQEALERWRETIAAMETAEDFGTARAQIAKESEAVKALAAARVAELGLVWDKTTRTYTKQEALA